MKKIVLITLMIFIACSLCLAESDAIYKKIKIKEIFAKLIIRNEFDRVYSGQIKSQKGFIDFKNKYIASESFNEEIDFNKSILIFGITDNISTRVYEFLKNPNINKYILNYYDIGIEYKLRTIEKEKKYSFMQIFIIDRIDDISHVKVKNLVTNELSKTYE